LLFDAICGELPPLGGVDAVCVAGWRNDAGSCVSRGPVAEAAGEVPLDGDGGRDVEVDVEAGADAFAGAPVAGAVAGAAVVPVGADGAAAAPYNCCSPATSSASSVRGDWLQGGASAAMVAPITRESSNPSA